MNKKVFLCCLLVFSSLLAASSQQVTTFEGRFFSKDPKADGVTDLHGETEVFDNAQRLAFLNSYATYASKFWGDPGLDTPLFKEADIEEKLAGIKPQPLTSIRHTIRLDEWKAYGYKKGKEASQAANWAKWTASGAKISDGRLVLDGKSASPEIPALDWRFRMRVSLAEVPQGLHVILNSSNCVDIPVGPLKDFEIYGDLPNRRLFLSSEGKTVREIYLDSPSYEVEVPVDKQTAPVVTGSEVITSFALDASEGKASVDKFALYAFVPHLDDRGTPYWSEMIYDEDFNEVPSMDGWQNEGYNDSTWEIVRLPSALGGQKSAGESYYLRTKVKIGEFTRAYLGLESIDPAGDVWVNGEPVAVLNGKIPRNIDVSEYLNPGEENVIAVRVKPYFSTNTMLHSTSDHNFGWSLGRATLVLNGTHEHLAGALVHTVALEGSKALQHHRIILSNKTRDSWKGSLEINYFPWFPEEGPKVASISREIELRPRVENNVDIDLELDDPALWFPYDPKLYKVEVILKDESGKPIDDYVTTTGVRLIEQIKGELFVNHKPEMLNGGQIFGYRLPVENTPVTIRCATDEMVMKDVLMAKALGNLLRIHVHAEGSTPEGLNDARYAEYADQLGLYLIWQTSGWIREGEVWNVDIENYPLYMKSVFNHPSITMWEASNHPNRFKTHDFSDTGDYFTSIISTIAGTDSSRLISPTSFWQHSHYGNYDGTIDYKGNPLPRNPWLTYKMVTRGSQDSYSGYDNDWSHLRNIPSPWAKECLDAKDVCYFNFEHEESIAQPNWALGRKEPFYKVFSYEKNYEEKNVGRRLEASEWRISQAYQAFSAWESMKVQTLLGVCGFSWCSLESGPNMFTYQKPLVDPFNVPKLAFHANRMVFGRVWAGSDDVDVAYGPGDEIRPVIFNMDRACSVNLTVELQNEKGKVLERKIFKGVPVSAGRSVTRLEPFRFKNNSEGVRFVVYKLNKL